MKETSKKKTATSKKNANTKTKSSAVANSKKNIGTTKPDMKEAKKTSPERVEKTKAIEKEINKKIFISEEITNLIKIVLTISLVLLILYLITYVITKNKTEEPIETPEVTIQYNEILLSDLLTQNNKEYYVVAYGKDDKYVDTYEVYIQTYKGIAKSKRVYTSLLSSGFNKKYIANKSVTNIDNINDLKLAGTTLIRIKNKKIIEVFEGTDAIIAEFQKLTKK